MAIVNQVIETHKKDDLSFMNNYIEWRIDDKKVPYSEALEFMETRVKDIRMGKAREIVWLLEHPSLYTAGTSALPEELLEPDRFPVYQTGRGGKYTYHGPGQRVAYVMVDLKSRKKDVRKFVWDLEEWVIKGLSRVNVLAERREGRVGIWVPQGARTNPAYKEDKIASIGVRVRHWICFHGVSINIEPQLSHFDGIVPCGVSEHGVTSLRELGNMASIPEFDTILRLTFEEVFQRETTDYLETKP